eukprot:8495314-Prorocentrum_lima.AAC.1
MTSSLVGSEMCIRDRAWLHLLRGTRLGGLDVLHSALFSFQQLGSPATPVSYTHLTLPTICSV